MNRFLIRLPLILTLFLGLALLWYGPIAQPAHYHEFADQRVVFGLANGVDVLSNIGFFIIGCWGLVRLWPARNSPSLACSWSGYRLFLCALMLTAIGSTFYHLAPDNFRLIFDRIPIALACVGILAAVRAETRGKIDRDWVIFALSMAAVLSVLWWYLTEQTGHGDLRPYLLLQCLPLLLIPLWQAIYRAPRADRIAFGIAIALYIAAKVAELHDREILLLVGWISGHSIKHILATFAAAVLTARLAQRTGVGALRAGRTPIPS